MPSSVVPVGQAALDPPEPTFGTAVQAAVVPPKFADEELQVQSWKDVSFGPFTAPTKLVEVKKLPSVAGLLGVVSGVLLTG